MITLAAVVVFVTTYLLILPAITLDEEEAAQQGGIDVTTQEPANGDVAVQESSDDADMSAQGLPEEGDATAGQQTDGGDAVAEDLAGKQQTGSIIYEGKGYTVSVDCDGAGLPEGTAIQAQEISRSNQDYEALYEDALKAVQQDSKDKVSDLAFAKFYDISLNADGELVEPDTPVDVSISYDKALKTGDAKKLRIVHFAVNKKTGKVTPEVLDETSADVSKGRLQAVAFEAPSFSMYGIVGTTIEKNVLASDGHNYKISVTYGSDANLPDDVDLDVKELNEGTVAYTRYLEDSAEKLGVNADAVRYARIFDISLVSKEDPDVHYQPEADVHVSIELTDADESRIKNMSVLHIADDQVEVMDSDAEGRSLNFKTGRFSIYPIVDTGDNARIGYRFWYNDGIQDILLSTQYFRYKDVHPAAGTDPLTINEPSIPGIESATWNRIFRGWSKSSFNDQDENLINVETLNNELTAKAESDFTEGTFVDVYANLKDVYYVTFVDVNPNNILMTEIVPLAESGDTKFSIKPESQLRPTIDSDTVLQGWYDINDPGTIYPPGQENVTINSNLTLYPKIEGGSWLIFNDNDPVWDEEKQEYVSGGASFTPPAFYLNEVTQRPADPTWAGYEFGGWYTDADCTTPFTFGGTLDHDMVVYAKWIPSGSAYRVIIWKQRTSNDVDLSDDEKTYDYVTSYLIDENVKTGDRVTLENKYKTIYGPSGTSTDTDKAYFIYNGNKTDQAVVVKADGSSVLNVYYDRKPVTLEYYIWDYGYTATTSNNGTQYGLVDGQYVQLTRSGNTWSYTVTEYTYTLYTGTSSGDYYIPDGNGGYTAVHLYRNNNRWYKNRTWSLFGGYSYSDEYTGDVYTRSSTNITKTYTGTRYTRNNNRSWQLYKSFTGLYGSTLEENGYSWPEEYNWYSTGGNNGSTSGTRTTFMSAFLPTEVDTSGSSVTVKFYGSTSSGSSQIHFLVQNEDGTYTEKDTITANGGNFYISDKYIGYHASEYSTNNTTWQAVGSKNNDGYYNNGNPVSYSNDLYIRFDRTDYNLTFYTNNGMNQLIEYTVPYSSALSGYGNQSPGQRTGYYFLGWFADPGCTEPFDFTQTMPDSNLAVYGKWKMERFRIVIEPGGNNVYVGSQATRFRLDYDERIDGGLLESATRAGYILDGWYTDPEFTNRFLFSSPVNSSTPGVDMTYQDSPEWAAARAAYGDDDEAHENVRGILHLYAKWIPDPDSTGINVVYDAGEAAIYDSLGDMLTTVPIDTHMYGMDGTATAREAPSNYNDLYTFKYWEAAQEDGTTVTIYPSDPVDLANLVYSDPVLDENGDLIRKTVTLRAVYDLTGDPSHITHITYDGDTFTQIKYSTGEPQTLHGETRDGTHRQTITLDEEINQTIILPDEDDFYLDGYTLVGWSFFEGSYQQQQDALAAYNAEHADNQLTNFTPGQEVAADNLDQGPVNDHNNTLYAMWQPKKYTVTVKQVIENGVPQDRFTYVYKTGPEDAIADEDEHSQLLIGNSSFTVENLDYYDRTGDVIRITTPFVPDSLSYSVRVNAIVTKDDGTTEILNPTAIGDYQILGDVMITYTYSMKVPVKLQKRDATDHGIVLTNAEFTVTPVEFNTSTQHWENAGTGITLTVNSATLERYLQEGTYRIEETAAPNQYAKIGTQLFLTVKKDTPFTLFAENGGQISTEIAELDSDGKILTVYDNPIREVTLKKMVESGDTGGFGFTVSVFNSDGSRLGGYKIGEKDETDLVTNNIGQITVTLRHNESIVLNIPHGCKLKVEEAANAYYEASYKWNNEPDVASRIFGSEPVTITANGNLTYTNTIAAIPVVLKKVGIQNTDVTPEETDLAGATFTVYTSETGSTIAKDADGTALSGIISAQNGVFFNGKMKLGTYYLEETDIPAGYYAPQGRFKLVIGKEAASITGDWITGDTSHSAGTVTGDAEHGYTITVRNVAGVALPDAGGPGTYWIYLLGAILLLGSSIVLVSRRRTGKAE